MYVNSRQYKVCGKNEFLMWQTYGTIYEEIIYKRKI